MTDLVRTKIENGVLEITWNRPDKKNALSNAMYRAATTALLEASDNKAVRVVLLTSEGDAFTSGNDLADFAAANAGGEPPAAMHFIEAIGKFDKPMVAGVPGLAVGVGTTMLLHCDLVYVAETAKLSTPFVNLALAPEAASSLLLPARIGYQRAFAMFALGDSITGKQAAELGLANAALPAAEVVPAARKAAAALTQRPLGAVMATKRLMRDGLHLMARIHEESAIFAERLKTAEAKEAFAAFAQKRAPDFSKL